MLSLLTNTAEGAEPTLWQEIWDYIYTTYFAPDSVYFENISLGSGTMVTVRNVILGLAIGVIIASIAIIVDKRVLGNFVRAIIRGEYLSPENAKTLSELGFDKKYSIRNGVRRSSVLRSVVRCREEEEYNAKLAEQRAEYEKRRESEPDLPPFKEVPYSINTDTDHFYIPEEKKYSAEMRFEKKGTNWLWFAIIVIVCIVAFAVLLAVIPQILGLVDDFAGGLNNGPKNILK